MSSNEITVTWFDPNTREIGYSIERSLEPASGFAMIATIPKNFILYQDIGLTASTTYYYRVRAIDRKGNPSPPSNVASAKTLPSPPPPAPAQLTAAVVSCNQVNLSWTASTDNSGTGLWGYRMYKDGMFLKSVPAPTTSTSDSEASPETICSYVVSALDNAGNESPRSPTTVVNTPPCPDLTAPAVPTGFTATPVRCTEVDLSWNASTDSGGSGLKGYNVYRNGLFVEQIPVSGTATANTGLTPSTSYSYAVSAIDNAGNESAQSTVATLTPACVIEWVSVSTTFIDGDTGTMMTIVRPSGSKPGDFLIAHISGVYIGDVVPPAGWTLIRTIDASGGSKFRASSYYKLVGVDEPNGYEWQLGSLTIGSEGAILAYDGVDVLNPIDVEDAQPTGSETNWRYVTPSVSTTVPNATLIGLFGCDAFTSAPTFVPTWNAPVGMAERYEARSVDNTEMGADSVQALEGSTGEKEAQCSTLVPGTAEIIVLRPTGS